jgi:hypothetical protein
MAFRVINVEGLDESFADADRYTFTDKGLLVVHTGDGRRRVYSPHGWRYVEEDSTPPEGPHGKALP